MTTTAHRDPRVPLRDRPTLLSYAQLAIYTALIYAFGPSMGQMQDEQSLSTTQRSFIGAGLALGSVLGGFLAASMTRRLGRGNAMRYGAFIVIVGVFLFISGLPVMVEFAGATVMSTGATVFIVGCNSFLSEHQGHAGPASLNEANGFASVLAMVGVLTVSGFVSWGFGWRWAFILVVVGFLIVEYLRGRKLAVYNGSTGAAETSAEIHADETAGRAPSGPMPSRAWWAIIATIIAVGIEFSMNFWAADLVQSNTGMADGSAIAIVSAITAGMAVGRFSGTRLVERFDPDSALLGAFAAAFIGFWIVWSSSIAALAFVGLFIAGTGIGLQWPLSIGRSIRASLGRSDRAGSYVAIGAGISIAGFPFLLGALADSFDVKGAFILVPVSILIAAALVLFRPVHEEIEPTP